VLSSFHYRGKGRVARYSLLAFSRYEIWALRIYATILSQLLTILLESLLPRKTSHRRASQRPPQHFWWRANGHFDSFGQSLPNVNPSVFAWKQQAQVSPRIKPQISLLHFAANAFSFQCSRERHNASSSLGIPGFFCFNNRGIDFAVILLIIS